MDDSSSQVSRSRKSSLWRDAYSVAVIAQFASKKLAIRAAGNCYADA
jgi:hypothetical protein